MTRSTANLLLLFAAAIWGSAFVPQQTAMRAVSPMWFLAARYAVTLVVLAPFVVREARRAPRRAPAKVWGLMALIGVIFAAGNMMQQSSLLLTSVTNAGFLTSLYLIFTPFAAMALTRERPGAAVWPAAALGLVGAWFLSGGLDGRLGLGDALLTVSAVLWALQIVFVGMVMRMCDRPMLLVATQGLLLMGASLAFEVGRGPVPFAGFVTAAPEILATGLLSGVVAYSIQAVAQRHTEASDAAVIYAIEAPFAALGGWLFLGDHLDASQWAGAAAIFAAVVLVAWWSGRSARKTAPAG